MIPTGTRTATLRGDGDDPVVFSTLRDLAIVPTELLTVATKAHDVDGMRSRSDALAVGTEVPAFSEVPVPGDMLLIGLDRAAPGNAVAFHIDCEIDGVGVDPTDPPLAWEAWNGLDWERCDVENDETGGLNRKGDIIVHLPAGHAESLIEGERAGWVRARVIEAHEGQPQYSSSPLIHGLAVRTVGGTIESAHAEVVGPENVGESSGQPGQRFRLESGALVATGQHARDRGQLGGGLGGVGTRRLVRRLCTRRQGRHPRCRRRRDRVPAARSARRRIDHAYGAIPPRARRSASGTMPSAAGVVATSPRGAIRTLKSSIPFVVV